MLVSFKRQEDGDFITHLLPNFDYEVCSNGQEQQLILHTKMKKEIDGKMDVAVLITDDPTPPTAAGWVSMGYFHQRVGLKSCEQISEEPATFIGKVENLEETWGSALR